jgi:hypothetical protein
MILLFSLVGVAIIIAGSLVFVLVHLVRNYPQWLFNPNDYDPSVQDELFEHDYSMSQAEKKAREAVAAANEKKELDEVSTAKDVKAKKTKKRVQQSVTTVNENGNGGDLDG